MVTPSQIRRLLALFLCMVVGYAGLGAWLTYLQAFRHEELSNLAHNNTHRKQVINALRGNICDRNGFILASSSFVKTICANPELIGQYQSQVAKAVAPILDMDERKLVTLLQRRKYIDSMGRKRPDQQVYLKHKVSEQQWQSIKETMQTLDFGKDESKLTSKEILFFDNLRSRGLFVEEETQVRNYPNKQLAAHVLGYTARLDAKQRRGKVSEIVGREGIEHVFNDYLTEVKGWRFFEQDKWKNEIILARTEIEARPGLNVILSIDARIQSIVEEELSHLDQLCDPISASAIVVRPKTGEILAMANVPTYNPNEMGKSPPGNWRNRAIKDSWEPGSTFKIVVVSGALNDRTVNLNQHFDCENGAFVYNRRTLNDDHRYGILSVKDVIVKSSNIGAAKIALKMGGDRMLKYVYDFGFGAKTGIYLFSEREGTVLPKHRWDGLTITRMPMGHAISCTPLQMIMAMSAIANGGKLMRPMLVNRLEDDLGNVVVQFAPRMVRQVVKQETAQMMVRALKEVVSKNGTAPKAMLDNYAVAGKTGTANKFVREVRRYVRGKNYASFIGFFPADDPELCISVVTDEPKNMSAYGGVVAAPAFKNISEKIADYLNIPPDIPLEMGNQNLASNNRFQTSQRLAAR
jgi:cell division protein FtsI/penicillin-binding protein 2